MARALQRSGHADEAKAHFKRFQHLTSAKIGAPIGLAYGEQGRYSTVTPVKELGGGVKAMIPVKLVATALLGGIPKGALNGKAGPSTALRSAQDDSSLISSSAWTTTGGACMMDVAGDGHMDLVLMQAGAQAIRVLHAKGGGSFDPLDAAAAGLKAAGHAVACAVGDYDADGLNDLAVALDDQVLLFKNLGNGKFQDVTAEAGLAAKNRQPNSEASTSAPISRKQTMMPPATAKKAISETSRPATIGSPVMVESAPTM